MDRSPGDVAPLVLGWPLRGFVMARNSPARRVPSHGTHLMGTIYSIDLIPVDARGRAAPWTWRTALATEAPEEFVGFGAPVMAPCPGRVVIVHDGEPDHRARRSQLALIPYALGQPRRLRAGAAGVAGNHIVIRIGGDGPFVLIAHLQQGWLTVSAGDMVHRGEPIASCGNSGNSSQPHVHVQATDTVQWDRAVGLPIAFDAAGNPVLPGESQIIRAG
ncbi:Secreted peptidase [Propionibacterium freudenreichii]|uniref:M23 family metallopeptidase n=1 Tax=Propionibacterium freudenreichii TaxID=1744 RepID=UPI000BC2EBFE|nr:M23 family metallopeptidase [Propionibacterium freudenreichii]SBT28652.1 Secreted peptidase [Propionibacterium freudenreichii]